MKILTKMLNKSVWLFILCEGITVSTMVGYIVLLFAGLAAGIAYAVHRKRVEKRQRQAEREENGLGIEE